MFPSRTSRVLLASWLLMVAWLTALASATARADRVTLRGGGTIQGHVLEDKDHAGKLLVLVEGVENPLVLDRDRVLKIALEDDIFDAYYARKDTIAATPQAQFDFGVWCEQHRLGAMARTHFQRAIELDKQFAPAHKKLGHVLHNGVWMTYDDQRTARGLIHYKGKWISREERERLEDQEDRAADESTWLRQLQILRQHLTAGSAEQADEAREQIEAIRDPAAIPALVRVLGSGEESLRVLLARRLSAIPGAEARRALVRRVAVEDIESIRHVLRDELVRRGEPEISADLLKLLKEKDPVVVGRGARMLADLRLAAAVPHLINALVRTETRRVLVPPAVLGPPPPVAVQSSPAFVAGTGYSMPVLGPPAVAPGAVAFGLGSIPVGTGVIMGGGVSMGANTHSMRIVTLVQQNSEVLAALEALTNRNFGYDLSLWRAWQRNTFRVEPEPARRVPQP